MGNQAREMDAPTQKTIERLLESGRVDTVYRDRYLQRASALLAPIISRDEYLRLKRNRDELNKTLKLSRLVVEKDDWATARDLAAHIGALRRSVEMNETVLKLGEGVYEPVEVLIDPFSSDIHGLMRAREASQSEAGRLAETLGALQEDDPSWRDFYAGRQACLRVFSPAEQGSEATVSRFDIDRLRREALQAVEGGDVARLDKLLAGMRTNNQNSPFQMPASQATASGSQADLGAPFPADAVTRA